MNTFSKNITKEKGSSELLTEQLDVSEIGYGTFTGFKVNK